MSEPLIHQPVMLSETIEALAIEKNPDGIYLDGTFGRGGHSQAILSRLSPKGRLICIDKDPSAIEAGLALLGSDPRVSFYHACFSELSAILESLPVAGQLNGILLDLGISSPQVMEAERGFSFLRDGPLDMRMDPTQGISAEAWLASASVSDIIHILQIYGEERHARKIALAIHRYREENPINTTRILASIVSNNYGRVKPGQHPATKTFQAIRIYINQELQALEKVLTAGLEALAPHGRFAIISFHSLEDRMVKRFFRKNAELDFPKSMPIIPEGLKPKMQWVVKRQFPTEAEVASNPRARSAILRVGEKN